MRTKRILPLLTLLLVLGGGACNGQTQDAELRQRLMGTWAVQEFSPNGTRTSTALWTVMKNGSFRRELTNTFGLPAPWVTSEGTVRVKGGFLIETITNVVIHGRPDSEQNRLPEGGVTGRTKIIRLDQGELVLDRPTNAVFGKAIYTKIAK